MGRCHLHLGSNQGEPKLQIAKALQYIEIEIGPVLGSSSFYSTEAWGVEDQPDFINIALEVECYLSPSQLLKKVNQIEDKLGRVRIEKWGPRMIDIDIIFMEDMIVKTKHLTIPHSMMHKRNFVLYPLSDLIPDFIHPVLNKTVLELKEDCEDLGVVTKIELID